MLKGELVLEEKGFIKIKLNKKVRKGQLFYKKSIWDDEKFLKDINNEDELVFKDIDSNSRNFYVIKTEEESLVIAEKLIRLKNFLNFRDLGGMRAKDGRIVKWGKIYRSEVIQNIEEDEIEYFNSLRIKYIFDYRTKKEAISKRDMELENIKNIQISAIENEENEILDMEPYFYKFMSGESKIPPVELLKETYKTMPFSNKAFIKTIEKLRDEEVPILQHCTSGKDRTGVATAIIYLLLGVDEESIIEDYLESLEYRKNEIEKSVKFYEKELKTEYFKDQFRRMLGVEREFIEASFKAIKEKYGTYEEYFKSEFGIDEDERMRIGNKMKY